MSNDKLLFAHFPTHKNIIFNSLLFVPRTLETGKEFHVREAMFEQQFTLIIFNLHEIISQQICLLFVRSFARGLCLLIVLIWITERKADPWRLFDFPHALDACHVLKPLWWTSWKPNFSKRAFDRRAHDDDDDEIKYLYRRKTFFLFPLKAAGKLHKYHQFMLLPSAEYFADIARRKFPISYLFVRLLFEHSWNMWENDGIFTLS